MLWIWVHCELSRSSNRCHYWRVVFFWKRATGVAKSHSSYFRICDSISLCLFFRAGVIVVSFIDGAWRKTGSLIQCISDNRANFPGFLKKSQNIEIDPAFLLKQSSDCSFLQIMTPFVFCELKNQFSRETCCICFFVIISETGRPFVLK